MEDLNIYEKVDKERRSTFFNIWAIMHVCNDNKSLSPNMDFKHFYLHASGYKEEIN